MTDTAPTPIDVAAEGVTLTVGGTDANGKPSLVGVVSPAMAIADPNGVFAFTPAADGLSATLVPNPGVEGEATVTVSAIGATGPLTASYVVQVPVGPATALTIASAPIVAAPVAPELFTFSGAPATVDVTAWPKATVETDTGQALYTWAGAPPAPVSAEWVAYTGPTQPVPAA